jgi:hypothetical protein
MNKAICRLMLMCLLGVSIAALAQSGQTMSQDNMKTDNMSKKSVSIIGKVSDDGKMLTSDKENRMWTVTNPQVLKGHEGHHVTVRGSVDEAKNEIHVKSVKMAKGGMNDNMKNDQMQH